MTPDRNLDPGPACRLAERMAFSTGTLKFFRDDAD